MSVISTHVLDTSVGKPARGVPVLLELCTDEGVWTEMGRRKTDRDGRVKDLLADDAELEAGRYRVTFGVGEYFRAQGSTAFYPEIAVDFFVTDAKQRYHVPLLLSPYGYSTYRGS
ncbi:MAG: hydroxyisourate hydrolase [Planctomycetes bacterium]|nr:hydroxyisourate hydrolase [Planctomycetota bacterium]